MTDEVKEAEAPLNNEQNVVEVGSLFAVINGDQLAGVEVKFNSNLRGAHTAASVLNSLNRGLHDAGWMFRNIERVISGNAQPDSKAEESSGADSEDAPRE